MSYTPTYSLGIVLSRFICSYERMGLVAGDGKPDCEATAIVDGKCSVEFHGKYGSVKLDMSYAHERYRHGVKVEPYVNGKPLDRFSFWIAEHVIGNDVTLHPALAGLVGACWREINNAIIAGGYSYEGLGLGARAETLLHTPGMLQLFNGRGTMTIS